jgi:hypothetical protein
MKILSGDFNAKVGEGVRLVNFATFKNPRDKSTMFPHKKTINIL